MRNDTPAGFENSAIKRKKIKSLDNTLVNIQETHGANLIKQGKLEQAEVIFRKLIKLGISTHHAYIHLSFICKMTNRNLETINLLTKALQLQPRFFATYNLLALSLTENKEFEKAIKITQEAIKLDPSHQEAHLRLGNIYIEIGKLEYAAISLKQALTLKPNCSITLKNLGFTSLLAKDLETSITYFQKSAIANPNCIKAETLTSYCQLLSNNYEKGWEKYEYRLDDPDCTKPIATPKARIWEGNRNLNEEKIIVVSEQGLGDTLQFMRYPIYLIEKGTKVSLCAPPPLNKLIACSCPELPLVSMEEANRVTENYWIPMLSLPRHLGITPVNPIVKTPYIKTTELLVYKWKQIISKNTSLLIGINWQGNPKTEESILQKGRSLPLESFSEISSNKDISLISLQKGFGSEQLQSCSFIDKFLNCQDEISETWDFLETAAIISNCNLIITSDTSVAHLAGGLGKDVWLLLKYVPEWRWGLEGESSFWYPSMRLFRQNKSRSWQEVMKYVASELTEYISNNKS